MYQNKRIKLKLKYQNVEKNWSKTNTANNEFLSINLVIYQ